MIELVNRVTGTTMWVAENRVAEYLAAGHKLVVKTVKQPAKGKKPQPKKTVRK